MVCYSSYFIPISTVAPNSSGHDGDNDHDRDDDHDGDDDDYAVTCLS